MKVNYIKTTGRLNGRSIGHLLPLNPELPYDKSMDIEKKNIEKQVPTLAVDGFNIGFLNKGKTGSYVNVDFLEDIDDKNAKIVSSVRLTPDQFEEFCKQIQSDLVAVNSLRTNQR